MFACVKCLQHLIAYTGKTLKMNDAMSQILQDNDVDKSKILYRDEVWLSRKTLNELHFEYINFERTSLVLYKSKIDCDYWNFVERKTRIMSEKL